MATSSSATPGANKPTAGAKTPTPARSASSTRKTAATRSQRSSSTTSTQPKTTVGVVQELAERAVLVPVGASLLVRDNLVSTVKGLATRYRTRASLERELKRYERRGATARNRFERQVRRSRTKFERELRQRRSSVEKSVLQRRRRLEREVRQVRRDLEKTPVGARVERLVSDVQGLLG